MVIALLVCAPLASAAEAIAPLMVVSAGEHAHRTSLEFEHGDLHVVLHHDNEQGPTGEAIKPVDHNVDLGNSTTALATGRQRDQRASIAVAPRFVTQAAAVEPVTIAMPRFETPPPLLLSAASILRI